MYHAEHGAVGFVGEEGARERAREKEATKHKRWLHERGGACSLPEVWKGCVHVSRLYLPSVRETT